MPTSREELLTSIRQAEDAVFRTLGDCVQHGISEEERVRFHRAHRTAELDLGALYRSLGELYGEEVVVPLDLGFAPSPSVSGATVLQDEQRCHLLFNTSGAPGQPPEGVAVVTFSRTMLTRFGLPNDEALKGHPLASRGLRCYACGEVLNSTWARDAEAQNRVAFPNAAAWKARHFVFTFHDSAFECLAYGLEAQLLLDGWSEILSRYAARLAEG